jgi:hypothetical protein
MDEAERITVFSGTQKKTGLSGTKEKKRKHEVRWTEEEVCEWLGHGGSVADCPDRGSSDRAADCHDILCA